MFFLWPSAALIFLPALMVTVCFFQQITEQIGHQLIVDWFLIMSILSLSTGLIFLPVQKEVCISQQITAHTGNRLLMIRIILIFFLSLLMEKMFMQVLITVCFFRRITEQTGLQ